MNKFHSISIAVLVFLIILAGLYVSFRPQLGQILGFRDYLYVEPETVTIAAVGDVMLGRSVNSGMVRRNDWHWPFLETADRLQSADITFGNLESPFGYSCPVTNEGMIFCADKRSVDGLKFAGFDVMSLANNHAYNQGKAGLSLSNDWLEENGINGIVQGEIEITNVNDIQIAWLAYDGVAGNLDTTQISVDITTAKLQSDLVIVSIHWGWEYTATPNPYQKNLAYSVIEAGADLIIGHHPHWRQTVEEYKGKTIFYSLGNFVFDQMWSEETRLGSVVFMELDKDGLIEYKIETVKIYDYAQPRWVESIEGDKLKSY